MERTQKPEVIFRKAAPIGSSPHLMCQMPAYEGPKQGLTVLKKGAVFLERGIPLPCDIIWERDTGVTLRDGKVIYVDIFRPVGEEKVPAILSWSPYGKEVPQTAPPGVNEELLSGLAKFEGPDPAYWCNHGYAIINVDNRGCFGSEGNAHFWGSQEAQDGYDVIEWAASQEWCNGKVSMSGNSWLAIAQWFIAAEQPPHLAAIAPWEGVSDIYREDVLKGGIPDIGFNESVTSSIQGNYLVEDVPAMVRNYPLMNPYWEDKRAKLEKITVPAYIVGSWTNNLHTNGTFEAFRLISSKEKWLRVHNTHEWHDYYVPENVEDLRRFFDKYLKGIENGWEQTPTIRLSVLDPGGTDQLYRPENEWPLARTQYEKLYLDAASGTLSPMPIAQESSVSYRADDGQGQASFTIRFDEDTELTGYFKLRVWVEVKGAEDMDLFTIVQKLDEQGNVIEAQAGPFKYPGTTGRQRVSKRQTDPERSTDWLPFHTHTEEQLLQPGEIVPCEIAIWPTGMLWHKGEQLRLTVAGFNLVPLPLPGIPGPITRNKGYHVIHTGGRFDSHLLVPKIPRA